MSFLLASPSRRDTLTAQELQPTPAKVLDNGNEALQGLVQDLAQDVVLQPVLYVRQVCQFLQVWKIRCRQRMAQCEPTVLFHGT